MPQPVAILHPSEGGSNVVSMKTICTSVSWLKTGDHSLIAAGYGSGVVHFWDLHSSSPLLVCSQSKEQLVLYSYSSVVAHSAAVTALQWCPISEGRYIATAGFDRFVKIWDTEDVGQPLFCWKRGLVRDVKWLSHWCGLFSTLEDCYNIYHTFSYYKECGYFDYAARPLTPHGAASWTLSLSEWLNTEVSCNAGGDVAGCVLTQMMYNVDNCKRNPSRRMPIYRIEKELLTPPSSTESAETTDPNATTEPAPAAEDKAEGDSPESMPTDAATESRLDPNINIEVGRKQDKEHPYVKNYSEATALYGLVFLDQRIDDVKTVPVAEMKRLIKPDTMQPLSPNEYPLASVNVIAWNPNLGAHLWLFTAGQSGLSRLSYVKTLHHSEAEKILAEAQQAKKGR